MRIAVIGAGVSGLTGAYALRRELGPDARIDVFESAERTGGILQSATVGGVSVDVGAEAFIVRRPEARDLIAELGLADQVVSPGGMRPAVWSAGALHALPSPALMGIPSSPASLADLIDDTGLETVRAEADRPLSWTAGADPSVGELVGDRFGRAVVDRSVDPMLGGVYSARADDLGLREAIPGLAAALDDGAPSLTAAVGDLLAAGARRTGPVFGALRGGYRVLVDALERAAGADVLRGVTVRGITRTAGDSGRFELDTDDGAGASSYDTVLVAVPVWTAGALLGDVAEQAAKAFAAVRAAGSAVVAVAVDPSSALPEHSGVLVASDADLSIKAITLSSRKWPHLDEGPVRVLRTSFGRLGRPVELTDDQLVAASRTDLDRVFAAAGLPAPRIVDAVVQRWPGGLPHYGPGHVARMAHARGALPDGIAVAGSGYDGVGVPACIGGARRAAARIAAQVASDL